MKVSIYSAILLPAPMVALMLADLFADPRTTSLATLSRGFHLLAVVLMLVILFLYARSSISIALAMLVAVVLKAFDSTSEVRFLYSVELCLLFAAAGYCAATFAMRSVEKLVFALLALSACVGVLQLLGVHAWFYLWSRHGYLAQDGSTLISPVASIFRGAYELGEINALQMRPSAMFASNQLFTGFILFASAIVLRYRAERPWLPAILLGVCIAVSAGKVAILGVPLIVAFSCWLVPSTRLQVIRITISFVACLALYVFLFPGVSNATMNPLLLATSLVIRLLDLLNVAFQLFGLQQYYGDFETAVLQAMDLYVPPSIYGPIGSSNFEWVSRADLQIENYDGGSMSLFAEAVRHPIHTLIVVILVVLVALLNGRSNPAERLRSDGVMIFALMLFVLVANVGASPLYWYLVGFGCYVIFGRAFKDADRS